MKKNFLTYFIDSGEFDIAYLRKRGILSKQLISLAKDGLYETSFRVLRRIFASLDTTEQSKFLVVFSKYLKAKPSGIRKRLKRGTTYKG